MQQLWQGVRSLCCWVQATVSNRTQAACVILHLGMQTPLCACWWWCEACCVEHSVLCPGPPQM
jgi:hypothetical protein